MKAFDLYQTLSTTEKKAFSLWLEKRYKTYTSEKNPLNILVTAINHFLEVHSDSSIRVLDWENWLIQNPTVGMRKMKNDETLLHQELENFLLNERKRNDSKILRLIDLYYIYRDRGIKERQYEIVKSLSTAIKESKELYLHYLYKQLEIEAFNATHHYKDAEKIKELLKSFHINWISDYIFLACHNNQSDLMLNDFLEKMPSIKNNPIIVYYLELHTFVFRDFQSIHEQSISAMYSKLMKAFAELPMPSYRQKDCYLLFLNKISKWFGFEKTYTQLRIIRPYIEKGINEENGWLYVGKYLSFITYSNYIGQLFMLCHEKPVETKRELKKIEKKFKNKVNFLGEKQEDLLALRINYYLSETQNYQAIYDTDTRRFPDILHKLQLIILQLKAGFMLMQRGEKPKTHRFWAYVHDSLTHYASLFPQEKKGIRWYWIEKEWLLWENLYIYKWLKEEDDDAKYAQASQNIAAWCEVYEKSDYVFPDKYWYITLIHKYQKK